MIAVVSCNVRFSMLYYSMLSYNVEHGRYMIAKQMLYDTIVMASLYDTFYIQRYMIQTII